MSLHRAHHATLLLLAFGSVVATILIAEAASLRRRGAAYPWNETGTSLAVAVVQRAAGILAAYAFAPLAAFAFGHRLWSPHLPGAAGAAAAFIIVELAYYVAHRASHRVAWMWATHSVHHSSERLTLAAAVRLGATGIVSFEWVPYAIVVAVFGLRPATVAGLLGIDLLYQLFLHTDVLPMLDKRQWIFTTPSDHRVHHASNDAYRDKNFGGVLIVFDRLFGTYAAERRDEPPVYGLRGEGRGANPLRVLFGGWLRLFGRVRDATSFGERVRIVLGPP